MSRSIRPDIPPRPKFSVGDMVEGRMMQVCGSALLTNGRGRITKIHFVKLHPGRPVKHSYAVWCEEYPNIEWFASEDDLKRVSEVAAGWEPKESK